MKRFSIVLPLGFVFSDQPIPGNDSTLAICAGYLAVDHRLPVHRASKGRVETALLGYAFDLQHSKATEEVLLAQFCRTADEQGLDAALDGTAYWLGRYCLIIREGDGANGSWRIVNDACATRPVYYGRDDHRFLVASHSNLVGSILAAREHAALRKYFRFGLPGFRTYFEGVRILPANFALDPAAGALERYWPRRPREETSADEAFAKLETLLTAAAGAIRARYRPAISLTAGLDSRVTFSLFRQDRNAVFFTYDRGRIDQIDLAIARQICDRYEAAHKRLRTRERKESAGVYALIDQIPDYRHVDNIIPSYAAHFSAPGWIHVRSNLSEIGRAFWRRVANTEQFSAPRIEGLFRRLHVEEDDARPQADELSRVGAAEMVETLGYDLSDPARPHLLGYDAWDLFYWEHRMTTWHGPLLLGSDIAFDTAIIFNCRATLDAMLSPPFAERASSVLLTRFADKHAPLLRAIPVNPKKLPDVKVPDGAGVPNDKTGMRAFPSRLWQRMRGRKPQS